MIDEPLDPSDPLEMLPAPSIFEPARDLPGAVLMIPNRHWGYEVVSADDHPSACLDYSEARQSGLLLQGTDASRMPRKARHYYVVAPTKENGLQKLTAFRLVPRHFRLHRLKLYFPERHIGRLDEATLLALRDELARLNPEE
jgi:hypothetical protein